MTGTTPRKDPPGTLVLVPGLLCDATVWQHAQATLGEQVQVHVGSSEGHDSLGALAEALLRSVAAPRFALAGHSMGGRIALEVMRRAPQRVQRLALLDSGWQARPPGAVGEQERVQRTALVELAERRGMRALADAWLPGMLHPEHRQAALADELSAMIQRSTPAAFARQVHALLERPDAAGVLEAIDCPTLVLCGRQDAWAPLARHEAMAQRIRGAQLVVVDDCGHMSTVEQPGVVTRALARWLDLPGR